MSATFASQVGGAAPPPAQQPAVAGLVGGAWAQPQLVAPPGLGAGRGVTPGGLGHGATVAPGLQAGAGWAANGSQMGVGAQGGFNWSPQMGCCATQATPGLGAQLPAQMPAAEVGVGSEQASKLTASTLQFLASGGRWSGLSSDLKRAAPELYCSMRQGTANVREWFNWTFGQQAHDTQQSSDLWHAAVTVDIRVEEWLAQGGVQGLAFGLQSDDVLEGLLRQLASAREFKLTGDAPAARAILAMRRPGDSILPQWLADEARSYSTAVWKQNQRTHGGRGKGKDGKGKGDGKGKPGGAQPQN